MKQKTATFADDILEAADGEPIEGIVLGRNRGDRSWHDSDHGLTGVVSWAEAQPILNYEYDTGYGGEDCHAIYAWTKTRVIFVSCYDGSTEVVAAPRNPTAIEPEFHGGG